MTSCSTPGGLRTEVNSSLQITAIVNEEVAAVEVSGITPEGFYDGNFKGVGWAKRHPTDSPNPERAFYLALSRAFQDLATQYGRVAASTAGFPVVVTLDAESSTSNDD